MYGYAAEAQVFVNGHVQFANMKKLFPGKVVSWVESSIAPIAIIITNIMNIKKLLPLLLGSLAACTGHDTPRYALPEFKNESDAQFEILSQEALPARHIIGLDIYGDNLIVYGFFTDNFINIYDKRSGALRAQCLKAGRGPGETTRIAAPYLDEALGTITFTDTSTKQIRRLDLDGIMRGEFPLINGTGMAYPWCMTEFDLGNGNRFVYNAVSFLSRTGPDPRMALLKEGTAVDEYLLFPFDIGDTATNGQFYVYQQSLIKMAPDRTRVAVGTTQSGMLLETFDIGGNQVKKSGVGYFAEPGLAPSSNNPFGFSAMSVTDKRIVAAMGEDVHQPVFQDIALFDWRCRPVKRFKTDRSIYALCIDESDGTLYAVVDDEEKGYLLARLDRKPD